MAATPTFRRLAPGDTKAALESLAVMAEALEEAGDSLTPRYADSVLARPDTWVFAAEIDGAVVGALTAHIIPMTRTEGTEVFIYDIGVATAHRRKGIGRGLIEALSRATAAAGHGEVWVLAETDDTDAVAFYEGLGADPCASTMFSFPRKD